MKRAVLLTSGTQIAIQAIGLASGVLVTRWLGPQGRGELAAIVSWAATFTSLGNLGLPVAFTYASAKNPDLRKQLTGNGAAAAVAQWLVLGALGWLILPHVLARHGEAVVHTALYYLWVFVPLNLLTVYSNSVQQGAGEYARYNGVRISVPVAYLSLLLLIWAFGSPVSVFSVVLANILSNIVALTLALTLNLRTILQQIGVARRASWVCLAELRSSLRYGLSAQVGMLQPFTGLQLDVLALTMLTTSRDLGLYMAALAGANLMRAQGYALGQVILPEVAKEERRHRQRSIIRRFMLLAGGGGLVGLIVVFLYAQSLLRLVYGSAFEPAAPMLKLLVAAGAVNAVYRVAADGLRGMGRPGVSTIAEISSAAAGIAALAALVPRWGVMGAAASVAIASLVAAGVALSMVWQNRGAD